VRVSLWVPCWTNYQTYQGNPCGVYPDLSSFIGSGVYPDLSSFTGSGVYPDLSSFTGSGVIQTFVACIKRSAPTKVHIKLIFFWRHWAIFFLNSRWQIMVFFTVEEDFLFWCCIKNLQCRSVRFFSASSTDILFRPKLACSHLFGQENISPSWQKDIIHRYW